MMIKRLPVLKMLFATELWERYGFYVVQSLLALYLLTYFHSPDYKTYMIVSSFTALTYVSPFVGGYLADKLLGHRRAVLWGIVILGLSYLLISLFHTLDMIMIALAGISIGTGLLKPNVSSLLGHQFAPGEPGRDSAFTLFYVGISLGIILGTTLPSYLQREFGWSSAFISAVVGMIITWVTFYFGAKYYRLSDTAAQECCDITDRLKSIVVLVIWVISAYWVIRDDMLAHVVFILLSIFVASYVLMIVCKESKAQRRRTVAFLLLCIISIAFWSLYFQMFLSLILFIHREVQPTLFNMPFPAPYYITVESIGLVVFGVVLSWLWIKLGKAGKEFSIPTKFSCALAFLVVAYALILLSMHQSNAGLISPGLLILAFLCISIGELLLSPTGLAMAAKLVRREVIGSMIGIFLVSLGIGGKLAGWLASYAAIPHEPISREQMMLLYHNAFMLYIKIAIVALIFSLLLMPIIKHLIGTDMTKG